MTVDISEIWGSPTPSRLCLPPLPRSTVPALRLFFSDDVDVLSIDVGELKGRREPILIILFFSCNHDSNWWVTQRGYMLQCHSHWHCNIHPVVPEVSPSFLILKLLFFPVCNTLPLQEWAKSISPLYIFSCQTGTALKRWPWGTGFVEMSYVGSGRKLREYVALSQLILQMHPAWSQEQSGGEGVHEPMQGHFR